MKISAKTDYACRALLELSFHWPNKAPLQISEIAKRQQIPIKFLTHILLNLKQFGYVDSTRGKSGGYLLRMPPRDIKLSNIIIEFGDYGLSDSGKYEINHDNTVMDSIWKEIDDIILKEMEQINFEIIRERVRSREHVMMYGI